MLLLDRYVLVVTFVNYNLFHLIEIYSGGL
jgi:hypothetical protein